MSETKTAIMTITFTVSIISVMFGYLILTGNIAQAPALMTTTGAPPPSFEITSVKAFSTDNQTVTGLVVEVQPCGSSSVNFSQGNLNVSFSSGNISYENVYNTSDFINASTFNSTYDANFTTYLFSAPNCSIIELNGNGSQVLEPGEQFVVFLNLNSSSRNCPLSAGTSFVIQIMPTNGPMFTGRYNIPENITPIMDLS